MAAAFAGTGLPNGGAAFGRIGAILAASVALAFALDTVKSALDRWKTAYGDRLHEPLAPSIEEL